MKYKIEILENHRVSKAQQIADRLAMDIDKGIFCKDSKVPSINEFSDTNKVARDTVEKAYRRLVNNGYLSSVKGIGYFVDK